MPVYYRQFCVTFHITNNFLYLCLYLYLGPYLSIKSIIELFQYYIKSNFMCVFICDKNKNSCKIGNIRGLEKYINVMFQAII